MSELDVFRHNPIPLRGRQLYYSQAIGTEALMADVILDQVADFDARHDTAGLCTDSTEKTGSSRTWHDHKDRQVFYSLHESHQSASRGDGSY